MKKKRFSVQQIVAVVKQAELGVPVAEVIHKVGISEQTFYRCKSSMLVCLSSGLPNYQVRAVSTTSTDRLSRPLIYNMLTCSSVYTQCTVTNNDGRSNSTIKITKRRIRPTHVERATLPWLFRIAPWKTTAELAPSLGTAVYI
jgi:hypothetical protein